MVPRHQRQRAWLGTPQQGSRDHRFLASETGPFDSSDGRRVGVERTPYNGLSAVGRTVGHSNQKNEKIGHLGQVANGVQINIDSRMDDVNFCRSVLEFGSGVVRCHEETKEGDGSKPEARLHQKV